MPIAFDSLDPPAMCAAFARGLNRPVRYVEGPIEVKVSIPAGYQKQLDALQDLFGGGEVDGKDAPYWWDGIFDADDTEQNGTKSDDASTENEGGDDEDPDPNVRVARSLWQGWRDIEGYARDTFPVEERLNKRDWMD